MVGRSEFHCFTAETGIASNKLPARACRAAEINSSDPSRGAAMAEFSSDDPENANKMRFMFGPGQVDQGVRQTIHICWMMLPEGGKTVDELERQFRRIVDRAIKDLREDSDAFGLPK